MDHAGQCDQSCYLCMQRFGNQPYHGLLDWRLGLAFLKILDDSTFQCGLDNDFSSPGLSDWPDLAARYAGELVNRYRTGGDIRSVGRLTAFRLELQEKSLVHSRSSIVGPR